ncbi:hypothetical protein VFPPC_17410 [Pochonia chlamydosporia 170]|uniref:Uncharacterized protein n=1 Tax=Pochonia chlamydosporia 170 TaxID=1380566 RepID=A0A219ARN5_METCM|nr:hypothetical protein VFPPC_17410 [Pochonia chlamydosporia 170]OWT43441.1 hypothetical protein VFPPC_17410 [Pochonia chlamydosporia 170]
MLRLPSVAALRFAWLRLGKSVPVWFSPMNDAASASARCGGSLGHAGGVRTSQCQMSGRVKSGHKLVKVGPWGLGSPSLSQMSAHFGRGRSQVPAESSVVTTEEQKFVTVQKLDRGGDEVKTKK